MEPLTYFMRQFKFGSTLWSDKLSRFRWRRIRNSHAIVDQF